MEQLYRLLGIVENHSLVLEVSKDTFIPLLKKHVGEDINSSLDIFSSNNYHYRGRVGHSGFYLRRIRGILHNRRHFCKAIGSFREENNQLIIDIEFKNFSPPVYFYLILTVFFGLGSCLGILSGIFHLSLTLISQWVFNLMAVGIFAFMGGMFLKTFSAKTIQQMKFEMENNFYGYLKTKV